MSTYRCDVGTAAVPCVVYIHSDRRTRSLEHVFLDTGRFNGYMYFLESLYTLNITFVYMIYIYIMASVNMYSVLIYM